MRGVDNGRGLDPGRTLGSYQGDQIIRMWGRHTASSDNKVLDDYNATGVFSGRDKTGMFGGLRNDNGLGVKGGTDGDSPFVYFDTALQVPSGDEVRVKNIAVNFIIKA